MSVAPYWTQESISGIKSSFLFIGFLYSNWLNFVALAVVEWGKGAKFCNEASYIGGKVGEADQLSL